MATDADGRRRRKTEQRKARDQFSWMDISESDWQVSGDTFTVAPDAIVLFENITVNDTADIQGKMQRVEYARLRILTDAGRDWANVEVPLLSIDQEVYDVQARTVLRDGTVIPMTLDDIHDQTVVRAAGARVKQTSFSVSGTTSDCIVEYMIEYRLDSPIRYWVVQKDIPLLKGEYTWYHLPLGRQRSGDMQLSAIRALFGSLDTEDLWLGMEGIRTFTVPMKEDSQTTVFGVSDVPPFEEEPFTIVDTYLRGQLITYLSTSRPPEIFWGKQVQFFTKYLEKKHSDFGSKIKDLVTRWVDLETDQEKIDAAYTYVQDSIYNLTYFDLEDSTLSEKREALKIRRVKDEYAEDANEVLKRRYAYDHDLCYLFRGLLKAMGIDARIAFTRDRSEGVVVRQIKRYQFDGTIVAVASADSTYTFYAPIDPYLEPGVVPWYYEGALSFIEASDGKFVPIPLSDSKRNLTHLMSQLTLTEDLEVSGVVKERILGQEARSYRLNAIGEDEAEALEWVQERMEDALANAEISSVTADGERHGTGQVTIGCDVTFPDVTEQGNLVLIKPADYLTATYNPFTAAERRHGILFSYAYEMREILQLQLPDSAAVESVPADTVFANKIGRCGVQYTVMGQTLSVQRVFTLNYPLWSSDDYADVQKLFQARQEFSNHVVVVRQNPV